MTFGAQRPTERPRLSHAVPFDELDLAEQLPAALLQAGGDDLATNGDALDTEIGRPVALSQTTGDKLAKVRWVDRQHTDVRFLAGQAAWLRQQRERLGRVDQTAHGDLCPDPRAGAHEAGVAERGAGAGADQHDIVGGDLAMDEVADRAERDECAQLVLREADASGAASRAGGGGAVAGPGRPAHK